MHGWDLGIGMNIYTYNMITLESHHIDRSTLMDLACLLCASMYIKGWGSQYSQLRWTCTHSRKGTSSTIEFFSRKCSSLIKAIPSFPTTYSSFVSKGCTIPTTELSLRWTWRIRLIRLVQNNCPTMSHPKFQLVPQKTWQFSWTRFSFGCPEFHRISPARSDGDASGSQRGTAGEAFCCSVVKVA